MVGFWTSYLKEPRRDGQTDFWVLTSTGVWSRPRQGLPMQLIHWLINLNGANLSEKLIQRAGSSTTDRTDRSSSTPQVAMNFQIAICVTEDGFISKRTERFKNVPKRFKIPEILWRNLSQGNSRSCAANASIVLCSMNLSQLQVN